MMQHNAPTYDVFSAAHYSGYHTNNPVLPITENRLEQAPDLRAIQPSPTAGSSKPCRILACTCGMLTLGTVATVSILHIKGVDMRFWIKPSHLHDFDLSRGPHCTNKTLNPANDWETLLGDETTVDNSANLPGNIWDWSPDGHISSYPLDHQQFAMVWPIAGSWRTIGNTAYPEDMTRLNPNVPLVETFNGPDEWNNGGSWLMSVIPSTDDHMLGVVHGEYIWDASSNPSRIAWKSIGITHSADQGESWSRPKKIITIESLRPPKPEWGGAGDCSAIWDCSNERLIMFYSESTSNFKITAASTDDPSGISGWKKWDGQHFSSPAINGKATPLAHLEEVPGANPSVQWNNILDKWVMVWHGWDGNIYLSASQDALNWDLPQLLVTPSNGFDKVWYPTLIDPNFGDAVGESDIRLYYAAIKNDANRADHREFVYRTVDFIR